VPDLLDKLDRGCESALLTKHEPTRQVRQDVDVDQVVDGLPASWKVFGHVQGPRR
jgi:hypothetical protein